MPINRALIPSMILTASLVAGGCNNKTKSQDAQYSAPVVETVFTAAAKNKDFERLLTVKRRDVKPADKKIALAKMGLDDAQTGPFKWSDQSHDKSTGDVTYKNLTATGEDGEHIKIGTLTLTGAHIQDENPSFDRADIGGLVIDSENAKISIDRVSLARPSPALGASIMNSVEFLKSSSGLGKDMDIDLDGKDISFGALLIDNLNVTSEGNIIALNSVGWGEDEETQKGLFLLEDLNVKTAEASPKLPVNFSLGSISASGVNMKTLRQLRIEDENGDVTINSEAFNLFSPMMDDFSLRGFDLSVENLKLKASAIDTVSEQKKGFSTYTQTMAPVTFGFSEKPTDAGLLQFWDFLNTADFEELEISGSSVTTLNETDDSFKIENGIFSLKDGFDFKFAYKGNGLKAMNDTLGAQANVKGGQAGADVDAALGAMTFDQINLSVTDHSIIDRGMAVAQEQMGMPEFLVRGLVKGSLMGAGAMAAQQAENPAQEAAISDMVNAIGGFFDNGGTLTVDMNPATPISAAEFIDANVQSLSPQRLGLSITHEE